jgi:hypothetical protein
MREDDVRCFVPVLDFDPEEGTIVREPPGQGPGYWAGAPGAMFDKELSRFFLVYRLRRPRGVEPDRGGETRIASSRDGIAFEDIWSGTKAQVNSTSIERSALVHTAEGVWRLYVSYVDPADGRWQICLVEAAAPNEFDLSSARPILTAADIGEEGVKDPYVFNVAGLYHMVLSYATNNPDAGSQDMHGTNDAYNTGLIKSASGLATSRDGVNWNWEGNILMPNPGQWDQYAARIGTLWYQAPVWIALYDGSADVSANYEEKCGAAYSFDLRTFHRTTPDGPLFNIPHATGSIRYFDVIALPDKTHVYYEMARPDGSHELRVHRMGPVV